MTTTHHPSIEEIQAARRVLEDAIRPGYSPYELAAGALRAGYRTAAEQATPSPRPELTPDQVEQLRAGVEHEQQITDRPSRRFMSLFGATTAVCAFAVGTGLASAIVGWLDWPRFGVAAIAVALTWLGVSVGLAIAFGDDR